MSCSIRALLAAAAVVAAGCSSESAVTRSDTGSSTSDPTTSGTSTGGPSTSTGDAPTTTGAPPPDLGGSGGMCNLFLQDCTDKEKCTAFSMDGSFFPNGTRCVPITGDKQPGEGCSLDGPFGDGVDDCAKGSICLDIENSGDATCVAYCSGNMDDPKCPGTEDKCAFLFEPTVPLCFPACDPLQQNCPPTDACVPNIAALGAEFFVCMPLIDLDLPGNYGDLCIAISGCDKGFQCIFGENVPGCETDYCCSVWCDLDAPESCAMYDDLVTCVPWYEEGKETPGYESVGICGLMP
jgi:hypothetical protein